MDNVTADHINEFTKFVVDDLRHRPYPSDFTVTKRWQNILNQKLQEACTLSAPDLAWMAMARAGFDMNMNNSHYMGLGSQRYIFDVNYPELRDIKESLLAREGVFSNNSSPPLEQSMTYYDDIRKGLGDESLDVVLEIGPGFGRTLRILKLLGTHCCILVDLPEALVFSYAYLRANFPDARFLIVDDLEFKIDTRNYDFIFCSVQHINNLSMIRNVDLAISTHSLCESPQTSADYLVGQVERLQPRYFYSRNIMFSDKTLQEDCGGSEANEICLNVAPHWLPKYFELQCERDREAYGHTRFLGRCMLEWHDDPLPIVLEKWYSSIDILGIVKYGYFAALWDKSNIPIFLEGLRRYIESLDMNVDFKAIGEVKYFKKILAEEKQ